MRRVLTERLTRLTRRPQRAAVAVAAIAVAAVASACLPPPPPPPPKPPVLDAACNNTLVASSPGTVASDAITEASGIAASSRFDNVYWVHNDSGDTARVFAISGTGQTLGEFALSGATAVDWEDVAAGIGPTAGVSYLYVGDIGDNAANRTSVQVYRVPEPSVDPNAPASSPQTLTGVATLNLKYPNGAHDAEALLLDHATGELFVITKDLAGGVAQVFRAPPNLAAGSTTTLTQVATVSLGAAQGVTAADMTGAGDVIALRTYFGVFLYPRDSKDPARPGRLRLLYEANPIGFVIEQAGGRASTGRQPVLEVTPGTLHQRIGLVFGSRNEVERIERYHADPARALESPLFCKRGLFRE